MGVADLNVKKKNFCQASPTMNTVFTLLWTSRKTPHVIPHQLTEELELLRLTIRGNQRLHRWLVQHVQVFPQEAPEVRAHLGSLRMDAPTPTSTKIERRGSMNSVVCKRQDKSAIPVLLDPCHAPQQAGSSCPGTSGQSTWPGRSAASSEKEMKNQPITPQSNSKRKVTEKRDHQGMKIP